MAEDSNNKGLIMGSLKVMPGGSEGRLGSAGAGGGAVASSSSSSSSAAASYSHSRRQLPRDTLSLAASTVVGADGSTMSGMASLGSHNSAAAVAAAAVAGGGAGGAGASGGLRQQQQQQQQQQLQLQQQHQQQQQLLLQEREYLTQALSGSQDLDPAPQVTPNRWRPMHQRRASGDQQPPASNSMPKPKALRSSSSTQKAK
jgi:hypothetical protein